MSPDRPGSAWLARPRVALLILAAAWLVLFAPQLLARQVFVLGDARVYRPFSEFSRERWRARHERTFWNPYVMAGVAATASLADMRPQYLPDLLLDAFERVRPGRFIPLAAPLLAHLLGMCAMAVLVWRLWAPSTVALVWAGLAWGLSPLLLVPLAFGHTAYFVAASLVPAMLVCVHAASEAATRTQAIGAGLALAGLAGLQALTGHPQVLAYSGVAVLGFGIERAVRARRLPVAVLTALALAWGAAIATAVWLPAMRYGEQSVRGGGGVPIEHVQSMSIAWRELLAFAFPRIVGGAGETYWGGLPVTDYPRFFGTCVMLFAALAATRHAPVSRRPHAYLLGVTAVAVALALGPRLGPVYAAMRAIFPVMGRFRVASMALVMALAPLALLSARGVGDALERTAAPPRWLWPALGGVALLGVSLLTIGAPAYAALATATRPEFRLPLALAAAHAAGADVLLRTLLLAVVAACCITTRWPRARAIVLVGVLAIDLGVIDAPMLRRASAPERALTAQPEPALARFGREDHTVRVLSTRAVDTSEWQIAGLERQPELRTNDWTRWRARAWGGEHGTPSASWDEFGLLGSSEAVRALGIAFVSSLPSVPQDPGEFIEVARSAGEVVYRLRDALGRAYTVGGVRALASATEVKAAMLSPAFRADSVAYTLEADAAGDFPGSRTARIEWVRDDPDDVALRVTAAAPAFLVLADAAFPGWKGTLDRAPVAVHGVNEMLRGVAVPTGTHDVRFHYVPEGWVQGRRLTRGSLAAWLLSVLAWAWMRRTSHQSPSRAAIVSSVPSHGAKMLSARAPRTRK